MLRHHLNSTADPLLQRHLESTADPLLRHHLNVTADPIIRRHLESEADPVVMSRHFESRAESDCSSESILRRHLASTADSSLFSSSNIFSATREPYPSSSYQWPPEKQPDSLTESIQNENQPILDVEHDSDISNDDSNTNDDDPKQKSQISSSNVKQRAEKLYDNTEIRPVSEQDLKAGIDFRKMHTATATTTATAKDTTKEDSKQDEYRENEQENSSRDTKLDDKKEEGIKPENDSMKPKGFISIKENLHEDLSQPKSSDSLSKSSITNTYPAFSSLSTNNLPRNSLIKTGLDSTAKDKPASFNLTGLKLDLTKESSSYFGLPGSLGLSGKPSFSGLSRTPPGSLTAFSDSDSLSRISGIALVV